MKKKYDILLIDHRMPEMNGVDLLKQIKYDLSNRNRDSICIALTANVIDGSREFYLKAGFDDFLEKPVNGNRLEEMLLKFLSKEKIKEVKEKDVSRLPSELEPSVLEKLKGLEKDGYINIKAGLEFAGSETRFLETLQFFRDSIDKKADEIESLYVDRDMADYSDKVHALKSAAKIIGAYGLAEKAKRLEDAGRQNLTKYIKENNGIMLEEYRSYKKLLENI